MLKLGRGGRERDSGCGQQKGEKMPANAGRRQETICRMKVGDAARRRQNTGSRRKEDKYKSAKQNRIVLLPPLLLQFSRCAAQSHWVIKNLNQNLEFDSVSVADR